mgnify:CR=1 FL=1
MRQRNRKPYDWKQQGELAAIIDKMLRRAATRPGNLQHNLIQAGAELNVKVTPISGKTHHQGWAYASSAAPCVTCTQSACVTAAIWHGGGDTGKAHARSAGNKA